jgi:hypothetical protein
MTPPKPTINTTATGIKVASRMTAVLSSSFFSSSVKLPLVVVMTVLMPVTVWVVMGMVVVEVNVVRVTELEVVLVV